MSTTIYQTITDAIRSRFHTVIALNEAPELVTIYDNERKDTPTSPTKMWARCNIRLGESKQTSLGTSKVFRHRGALIVQTFNELERGTKEQNELVDRIRNAFLSVTVDGVVWLTPSHNTVGRTDNWWQVNVVCPFFADDIV